MQIPSQVDSKGLPSTGEDHEVCSTSNKTDPVCPIEKNISFFKLHGSNNTSNFISAGIYDTADSPFTDPIGGTRLDDHADSNVNCLQMPWIVVLRLLMAGILVQLLVTGISCLLMSGLLPLLPMPGINHLLVAGILILLLLIRLGILITLLLLPGMHTGHLLVVIPVLLMSEISRSLIAGISILIPLLLMTLVMVGILIPLSLMLRSGPLLMKLLLLIAEIGRLLMAGILTLMPLLVMAGMLTSLPSMAGNGHLLLMIPLSLTVHLLVVGILIPLLLMLVMVIQFSLTSGIDHLLMMIPCLLMLEIGHLLPMIEGILLPLLMIDHLLIVTDLSLMIDKGIDDEVKYTGTSFIETRNQNNKCHRHLHTLRGFCACGKCSLVTVFEHTCPGAYGELIPCFHSTTLMSYYYSNFLLPVDNWWRVQNLIMFNLLILGGWHLELPCSVSQPSSVSTCDDKWLSDTRTKKCTEDNYTEEDIDNIIPKNEPQVSSLQLKLNYSSFGHVYGLKDTTTICDPRVLANSALLLLLIAGDVEVNPGPRSARFRQLVKKLSDKIQDQNLQTQQCIIASIRATLLPEAKGELKTLEELYHDLCSSRKYCSVSDRIFDLIVQLLSLNMTDSEQQLLKEQANLQPEAILNSKDIKILKLINFLSYEPKESLIAANVLPESARGSSKDAAEIISGLIQTGHITLTSASLINLLKSANKNEPYKMKIKEVLDAPMWMAATATTTSLNFGDLVEPDSPKLPESSKSLGAVAHGSGGWTAPIMKSNTLASAVQTLSGDEPISSPTIRELATFPTLGDAWEDLGVALSIDEETLQSINKKFPNLVKKQREMFRTYLKSSPNPAWSDIINALVKIKKKDIARKVIDTFNLSSKHLATAITHTSGMSIRMSSSLETRIEPDTGELLPARVRRTDMHSSLSKSSSPFPMPRIESDTVTPMPKRVSKTEILPLKKSAFDSSRPQPKQPRLVSDDGVEETDSYFPVVERDSSTSLPPDDEGELKSIPTPFDSDPIRDKEVHSSSDREFSIRKESELSLEENSPSSEDFHSAEETPLDVTDEIEKTVESDKNQRLVPGSHLSHQGIRRLREAVMSVNVEEIKHYIGESRAIVDLVLEVNRGQTALHIAAKLGFKDVAKILLQHKASVMVKDSNGCTPLYLAASSGNYEIAKLIIAYPECDMNILTKDGTPLLHDPASKGFSMICELLLENGTNPLTETRTGVSPLYISSKNGHKDVVRILLKFGADVTRICMETSKTPLQEAIDNEHIEVTKLLMNALTEVNKKNERLFGCKTAESIHDVIKHGANVDTRKANGSTPLIVHSSAGNKEVIQALIEEKANVDIQDDDGWSALMLACRSGHIEIVRSLIYAGAIPDLKNKEGLTALMCATLASHLNVIKELLLAKADPMLKRKDGRSAMEIAEQCGNQEIIAALKRHTASASSGNDPLYSLLGSYLELKKTKKQNGEKTSHDHMATALKRREPLPSLLSTPPGATARDDTSTAKQELEKCYKRIADLETRIHDLTLQNSVEVPTETDLAHLERRRLEDEYSKLKELKRKAEQYAVEAKQTAQRLSAENSKLREDLNKERKYNELTRANIVREFEHKVSHGEEKSATKMEIFEKEIEERAYQFLRRMPQEKGSLKRVELKAVQIKDVIFEKRVTINCVELAVMGLPLSGKTELLHQMLELKVDSTKRSSSINFHQAVLCHNQYDDSHTWIKSAGEDCSVYPVSTALVKTLTCMHHISSLSSCMSGLVDPSNVVDEFSDFRVNHHFKVVLENVQKVALQLESKGSTDVLKTSSLSLFTLANTKISRVAYDIFSAIASHTKNLVFLNVLNLEKHSPDNFVNPSLADGEKSTGASSIQHGIIKPESALHKYMRAAYVASRNYQGKQPRVIMIGTHKDKLTPGKLKETKKGLEQITMGYAESTGIAGGVCPGMECINTKDVNDCQRLQNRILELINRKQNFQYDIPINYLFLLSYLQSLQKMFISRKRLTEIAHTCGVTNEEEIEEFLEIFNNCGSIINSSGDEIPILRDYIIVNVFDFTKALDKLDSIKTMSFSDKLELFEQVDGTRLGFISEEMAAYLWPGEGEGRMTQAHFILTVLKEFKAILPSSSLLLEIHVIGKAGGGKTYFMPMLRAEHDKAEIQGDSGSLIITHNNAALPFQLQTSMILQIQNQFGSAITFEPKPYYNSIYFKWRGSSQDQSEVNIVIHFHTELVKVSVQFPNQAPRRSSVTKIYSHLKSACVQTFQLLSTQVKELKYGFNLVCPHGKEDSSISSPGKLTHFIQFDPLRAGEEKLFCQSCQLHMPSEKLPWAKLLWTQVAYQGPINNHKGNLTNEQISMVCQSLAGCLSLDMIESIATQLKSTKSTKEETTFAAGRPSKGLENFLHFLILSWKSRNPVNSIESLAKILHTCGCYQEALRLDPVAFAHLSASQESHPSLSDKEWSTIAAYLPQSAMKQLVDPKSKVSQRVVISREEAVHKLMELEYHSLAVALEIGWLL